MPCKPRIPRSRPCSSRQALQPLGVIDMKGAKRAAYSGWLLRRFNASAPELSSCEYDGGCFALLYRTSMKLHDAQDSCVLTLILNTGG